MNTIKLDYQDINTKEKKTLEFSKHLLKKEVNLASLFVITILGESMQPLILDKSLLVADLSKKEPKDESIYIIYKENEMFVKKYKDEKFVSINEKYKKLVFCKDEVKVVAKVVLTFATFD